MNEIDHTNKHTERNISVTGLRYFTNKRNKNCTQATTRSARCETHNASQMRVIVYSYATGYLSCGRVFDREILTHALKFAGDRNSRSLVVIITAPKKPCHPKRSVCPQTRRFSTLSYNIDKWDRSETRPERSATISEHRRTSHSHTHT